MLKYLAILFFFFTSEVFGFDSVKVSHEGIALHSYGYFKTHEELLPHDALAYSEKNQLSLLPQNAKSFGFDAATYWFRFDVSTAKQEDFVLAVKNLVATSCELFVFENDTLIRHEISGYAVPYELRPIRSIALRFELETLKPNITYLVKINSQNPHYTAFEFGTQEEVDKELHLLLFIITAVFAICFVMIFYNLALFFALKESTYLFYCLYIGSYCAFLLSAYGFLPLLHPMFASIDLGIPISISMQAMYVGLTFFTIHFLQLKSYDPKLKKQLLYVLCFMLCATLLVPIGHGMEIIAIFSIAFFFFFLLYSVAKTYLKGYKPAFFYLIATGIAIVCSMVFMNMNQGGGIPYTIWTFNMKAFGLLWDIFFLSFAIAHRMRLLHEQNIQNERLLMLQSRQKSIGELTGNIAHQWREPLSKMGSLLSMLEAKLKYENIKKEETLKTIMQSNHILQYLSQTINTFQELFQHQTNITTFDAKEEILKCINFLENSLMNNAIKIDFIDECAPTLKGDGKHFFQALLNIILNAKDAIISRSIHQGVITIKLLEDSMHWVVTIHDNGGGITIMPVDKIFDIYETNKENGTGIGLFITKSIIEAKLGGKIRVSNEKDGAVFTLLFPKSHT